MGEKAAVTFTAAARGLPPCLRGECPLGGIGKIATLAGGWGSAAPASLPLAWPQAIAATVVSLGLLIIYGIAFAYGLNVHTVGQTLIYIILRKKKDDENLLEMFDDELEQAMLASAQEEEKAKGDAAQAPPA